MKPVQQPDSIDMARLFASNPNCRLERATGFNVYCRTHKVWNGHDPAELERIARFLSMRMPPQESNHDL